MRCALIDNSTLTAVQRILGDIPIKNKHLIDADILALESYLQAILFYDQLLFLDDYKEQYQASRKKYFSTMRYFTPSEAEYNALISQAKKITEEIVPCVEGGKFKDQDFAPFFEQLKMNVTFTWDLNDSVYYLTQKMLEDAGGMDIPKYSKLASTIYAELQDKRGVKEQDLEPQVLLYDSQGNIIDSNYLICDKDNQLKQTKISRQVELFFSGLNWLAFRTAFYTILAQSMAEEGLEIDLFLHPIRNGFQLNLLSKIYSGNPSIFKPIISAMNGVTSEAINKVMGLTQPFVLQHNLPMFTVWLAEKVGDPHRFIEAAYELHDKPAFVQARQQLLELEKIRESDQSGFTKKANQLVQEVQKQMNTICTNYGVNTPQGVPLSPMISVWNVSTLATQLPKVPNLTLPSYVRNLIPSRGFKAVYRTLIQDLTQIARIGKYYELISSKIFLSDEADYYNSKVEQAKYSRYKSSWKIPM